MITRLRQFRTSTKFLDRVQDARAGIISRLVARNAPLSKLVANPKLNLQFFADRGYLLCMMTNQEIGRVR